MKHEKNKNFSSEIYGKSNVRNGIKENALISRQLKGKNGFFVIVKRQREQSPCRISFCFRGAL